MEAEYDQMADEYDATREAPTAHEVEAIASAIGGSKEVLDIGIGTGRFARPISDLGFRVTGVDVSRRMMMKAREKGLQELVLGDAYSLPFQDKTFDAAMIIHVIHVVADWRRVVGEIGRVTRGKVVTILRVPASRLPEERPEPTSEMGRPAGAYPVRLQHRMWQNEQELRTTFPPTSLERVRDEVVTISVADAFKRLEAKRPLAGTVIPEQFKRKMLERIIASSGNRFVHRRIVEDLASWSADQFWPAQPSQRPGPG